MQLDEENAQLSQQLDLAAKRLVQQKQRDWQLTSEANVLKQKREGVRGTQWELQTLCEMFMDDRTCHNGRGLLGKMITPAVSFYPCCFGCSSISGVTPVVVSQLSTWL